MTGRLETVINFKKFSSNNFGDEIKLMEQLSERYEIRFTIYRHHGSCELQGILTQINNVVIVSGSANALMIFRLQWDQPILQKPHYGTGTKLGTVEDGAFRLHLSTKLRFK